MDLHQESNAAKPRQRGARSRQRRENGFTLIEMLISLAILTIVGASITAAMSVGVRSLGAGETKGHLAAAHDVLTVQKAVAKDLSRASCVAGMESGISGFVAVPTWPYCTSLTTAASPSTPVAPCAGSGLVLCVGWRSITDSGAGACHYAVYVNSGSSVVRTEYAAGTAQPLGSYNVTTLAVGEVVLAANLTSIVDTSEPAAWGDFQVGLTVKNSHTNDSASLVAQPFGSDPSLTLGTAC